MKNPDPIAAREWKPVTIANAALAFTLEVGMLAALCYWGFKTGEGSFTKVLLGVGAPVLAGVVWGLFLAAGGPKFSLPVPARIVIKMAVFGSTALALYGTRHHALAAAFAGLSVLTVAIEYLARVHRAPALNRCRTAASP